jgi:class 3 adenylate cyclase/tetratricopeptide (TPR) repeat protein
VSGNEPAGPARFASPDAYTPSHLAERILTSKSALEGERKQVTVLFADLKGSMELLADRDPEEARALLDPVLESMMEAVHRYEGTVNQVMGDGIMALFGAPLAHEDHAVRACYAALRMQEAVQQYAEGVRRSEGLLVQIRVGLNSGEVVVRSIGSDLRMDYSAVGQTTHVAARLEQIASPGTTLVSGDTARLAEGYIDVRPLGAVNLRGLAAAAEVYELQGASAARTRFQAATARGLTRFVGRAAELEQVGRLLAQAAAGHGQVVGIVGEPGVGKSRLFHEITRSHRVLSWLVLESGSLSYGRATPYLPLVDLLRAYFHVAPRDDGRTIREKVSGQVLKLDRALDAVIPPLHALFDVSVDETEWQALDPVRRRQRTRDAVRTLLLRESQVQPLLLVFEDLHWIDSETQALLDGLVESVPGARLLLLVNYRPEYGHRWAGKTYYTQIRIDPLPAESAHDLLRTLLGPGPDVALLGRRLIEITEGNPLFLEETVRTLVETGVLTGSRGAHHLARPSEAIQIPPTVQALLAARIDRLPPDDKRLLQAAAVIGKDVPLALLEAVVEEPAPSLRVGLARLGAAELLYETRLFPDAEYTFKHVLTHDVAYGSLLGERRRALHLRIVDAIERLHADRLEEHIDALAHHSRRAEQWETALRYLRQAGARASGRLALREAADYLEQAVEAADHLPRSREVLQQSIDLRVALRGPLSNLGEIDRLRDHLSHGAVLALEIGDRVRLARIMLGQAAHAAMAGETRLGLDYATEAVTMAGEHPVASNVRVVLGLVQFLRGDYHAAITTLAGNVEGLRREAAPETGPLGFSASLASRTWLTLALTEAGRLQEAIALANEVVWEAEEGGNLYSVYRGYCALAASQLLRGEVASTIEPLRRAERIAVHADLQQTMDNAVGLLGHAHALAGRLDEALPLLETVVFVRKRRDAVTVLRDMLFLVDAYLRARRLDEARGSARQALDLARAFGQRGQEGHALRLLADVEAARDAAGEAESRFHDALVLASELRMRPLAAHCHAGLARLGRQLGKHQQAHEQFTTATTMYREMDMRVWLEKAEESRGP